MTVQAPPASADGLFAAFAYSPSTGVIGVAYNQPNLRAAMVASEESCRNHGPEFPGDCEFAGGVGPPSRCAVLAIKADALVPYANGAGQTADEAEADAVSRINGGLSAWRLCNGFDQGPGTDSGIWRPR